MAERIVAEGLSGREWDSFTPHRKHSVYLIGITILLGMVAATFIGLHSSLGIACLYKPEVIVCGAGFLISLFSSIFYDGRSYEQKVEQLILENFDEVDLHQQSLSPIAQLTKHLKTYRDLYNSPEIVPELFSVEKQKALMQIVLLAKKRSDMESEAFIYEAMISDILPRLKPMGF